MHIQVINDYYVIYDIPYCMEAVTYLCRIACDSNISNMLFLILLYIYIYIVSLVYSMHCSIYILLTCIYGSY